MLVVFLITLVNYNPGASDESPELTNKLMLDNVRLTNSASEGQEFMLVEKYLESFMRKWEIRGASVAVSKDGKLIYARGFGQADTVTREEVQPFYKFRVASISKLLTAVAVMKLAEEGRLSLNDRVFGENAILDDVYFSNPKDRRAYDISVAHLLCHEAGWSQRWGDQMFMPVVVAEHMGTDMPVDTRTIIRFALDKRLHFAPGTGRAYSNLGYAILGLVIEKISGMPYDEYCKKSILEPLGIYD
ncbi:MAG: beta-lactamase family protein, partial [Bacteroidales bacterium]|nr:beta-lactamase family protein [Bacteroidales bacterium]